MDSRSSYVLLNFVANVDTRNKQLRKAQIWFL